MRPLIIAHIMPLGVNNISTDSLSDRGSSLSKGPLFPYGRSREQLESLPDVFLCQRLRQLRAYRACIDSTAEEQLRLAKAGANAVPNNSDLS